MRTQLSFWKKEHLRVWVGCGGGEHGYSDPGEYIAIARLYGEREGNCHGYW